MPSADQFVAAAWSAAPLFGLAPQTIKLLSHSENVVCAVTLDDGQQLVMRLHRPGYNTIAELRSEVLWVKSLSAAGIRVPTAVPTTDGYRHYVEVDVGDETRHAGVVAWVPGQPLGEPTTAGGAEVVEHYSTIGSIAAQIRAHHVGWEPPVGFERRSWDADGFVGEAPLWGRFWEVPTLTATQQNLFAACRDGLRDELTALPTTPDRFGLIHADLHLGNLMADGPSLTVIDFDDAGFGWFAHELAVALHPVLDEPWQYDARAALLEGYRQIHPLDSTDEDLIDTFLTLRCLMTIGWLDARKELPLYGSFPHLVTQAENAAHRYLG